MHAPPCAARGRGSPGQAIVEMALLLPVLIFGALGFLEAGFLVAAKADQDRQNAVIAEWAAGHPGESWQPVAAVLLPGCTVAEVDHPDDPPDLLTIGARCVYQPVVTAGLWAGLPISSEASAVVR